MKRGTIQRFCSLLYLSAVAVCFFGADRVGESARGEATARSLQFELFDAHGRKVCSEDYAGIPLFLEFGACW